MYRFYYLSSMNLGTYPYKYRRDKCCRFSFFVQFTDSHFLTYLFNVIHVCCLTISRYLSLFHNYVLLYDSYSSVCLLWCITYKGKYVIDLIHFRYLYLLSNQQRSQILILSYSSLTNYPYLTGKPHCFYKTLKYLSTNIL